MHSHMSSPRHLTAIALPVTYKPSIYTRASIVIMLYLLGYRRLANAFRYAAFPFMIVTPSPPTLPSRPAT